MAWLEKLHHPEEYIKTFLKWGLLGALMGVIGGLLGAGFHHALHFVTHVRSEHMWLIFLLPVGGLLTVGIYWLLKMQGNKGTNEIIDATLDGHPVSPMVAPSIFLATATTHLFGGSAGREGAALQLGGSAASMLAKLFHLGEEDRKVMVMAGMSAVFAGLFGTPLTATLFCCATNSPLASIVLSMEMFGSTNLYLFAFVCVICFVLSGNSGLYTSQIIQFSKSGKLESTHVE